MLDLFRRLLATDALTAALRAEMEGHLDAN
jgi:hypothetical protein